MKQTLDNLTVRMRDLLPWNFQRPKSEQKFRDFQDFKPKSHKKSMKLFKTLDSQLQTDNIEDDYFGANPIFSNHTQINRAKTPSLGTLEHRRKSDQRQKCLSSFINESPPKKIKLSSAIRKATRGSIPETISESVFNPNLPATNFRFKIPKKLSTSSSEHCNKTALMASFKRGSRKDSRRPK